MKYFFVTFSIKTSEGYKNFGRYVLKQDAVEAFANVITSNFAYPTVYHDENMNCDVMLESPDDVLMVCCEISKTEFDICNKFPQYQGSKEIYFMLKKLAKTYIIKTSVDILLYGSN